MFAKILCEVTESADLSQLRCYDLSVAHNAKLNIYTDLCTIQLAQLE